MLVLTTLYETTVMPTYSVKLEDAVALSESTELKRYFYNEFEDINFDVTFIMNEPVPWDKRSVVIEMNYGQHLLHLKLY